MLTEKHIGEVACTAVNHLGQVQMEKLHRGIVNMIYNPDAPCIVYSRRFATATARTASLGSHSRGIETKNIRKYWLSEKKTRRIWWPCIADQRSSKNNEKHEKHGEIAVIYSVFARWEAETTANTMVFEGQVAKNTVIYSGFFNQRQKTLVFTMFSFTP